MSTIVCDDTSWPLAVCSFHGQLRDDDFTRYLDFLRTCHTRREPWLLLLDASKAQGVSAMHRRQMADFLREHEELAREFCMGTAFVFDSPIVRGALTAIFWFQKQPTPYTIVANRTQAFAWLHEQAHKHGAVVPRVGS